MEGLGLHLETEGPDYRKPKGASAPPVFEFVSSSTDNEDHPDRENQHTLFPPRKIIIIIGAAY